MKKSIITDTISALFIILFLYTGIFKLTGQELFKAAIMKSPLISNYTPVIALVIPVVEVLIALSLLIPFFKDNPRLRKWGLISSTALMAVFTLYVGYMLKFSLHLPCSCGGIINKLNWHQHLYFNTLFTVLGFIGIYTNKKYYQGTNHITFAS